LLLFFLKFTALASSAKHPRNAVGPAVRRHRVAYGWSQSQLAARCQLAGWDISRGIVAAIEGRVRWVGDFEVAVLAHVLRTSLVSLFPEKINWSEFQALATFMSENPNKTAI
jgi:transcriptional regulator with XRE-family HTH domain